MCVCPLGWSPRRVSLAALVARFLCHGQSVVHRDSSTRQQKGLRCRISPTCTLSQNGYGAGGGSLQPRALHDYGAMCCNACGILVCVCLLGCFPCRAARMARLPTTWATSPDPSPEARKRWSHVSSAAQRPLHSVLAHYPTTASSAWFCLLCCQPQPVPRSSAARMPRFTPRAPCRLLAWLGQAINTVGKA